MVSSDFFTIWFSKLSAVHHENYKAVNFHLEKAVPRCAERIRLGFGIVKFLKGIHIHS